MRIPYCQQGTHQPVPDRELFNELKSTWEEVTNVCC